MDEDDTISVDLSAVDNLEVEHTEEELFEMLAAKHRFQDIGKVFHIAIIDYLTSYTCFKRMEKGFKSLTADEATVSVAHPTFYGERFQSFMVKNVIN